VAHPLRETEVPRVGRRQALARFILHGLRLHFGCLGEELFAPRLQCLAQLGRRLIGGLQQLCRSE
jgi:hypothetical protein